MKPIHRFALASAIALFISACSQPTALPSAGLEPQFGTAGYDEAAQVSTNPLGDVFVSGTLNDKGYLRRYTRAGGLVWERYLSPRRQYRDHIGSAADHYGNAFLAAEGCYTYWVGDDSSDLCDVHVRKYSRNGQVLWQHIYADTFEHDVRVTGIAADKSGSLYVAGGALDTDNRPFLRKLGPGGKVLWTKKANGSGFFAQPVVSKQGNIFLLSYTWNRSLNGFETTLFKYSSAGQVVWQKKGVFADSNRGIPPLALGPNEEVYGIHARKANDYFPSLLALTPTGQKRWEKDLYVDNDYAAVTTDAQGNIYVAVDNYAQHGASFDDDILVSRYTPAGERVWFKQFGAVGGDDHALGLAAHTKNELYMVGKVSRGTDWSADWDAFLMRLDGQGKRVWSR